MLPKQKGMWSPFNAHIQMNNELPRHKYTLFVSADGNFKMQRKNKRDDPDDFALNDGNAYFVPTADYKAYMDAIGVNRKTQEKSKEEVSSVYMFVIRPQGLSGRDM